MAGGVDQLVEQVKVMAAGLNEASGFPLTMRPGRGGSSMAGFNIPGRGAWSAEF